MPGTARRVATGLLSALAFISQLAPSVLAESLSPNSARSESCEQWVVTLRADFETEFAGSLEADGVAAALGASVIASAPQLQAHVFLACTEASRAALAARSDTRIRLAFPNVGVHPSATPASQQWYLQNVGQPYFVGSSGSSALTNVQVPNMPATVPGRDVKWSAARDHFPAIDGSGVTVGVVDTGVDGSLPDFAGRFASGASIDCDFIQGSDVTDLHGHGTRVASLIAASGAGGRMTGVAPAARVLPVRPVSCPEQGVGSVFAYAMAVAYAGANADVINLSNGINLNQFFDYAGPGVATSLYIQALEFYQIAIDDAATRGAIIVASSGNGGSGGETSVGFLPGDYLFPASFPHVISVGSSRSDGSISAFSQWNDQVDIAAPGEQVLALRASTVFNCGNVGDYSCFVNADGSGGFGSTYSVDSGTSFSAPLVSGAAALAKQRWPRITSDEFEFLVRQTADDGGTPGVDPFFGAGTLNLDRMLSYNFPPRLAAASVSPAAVTGGEVQLRAQVENLEGDGDIASVTADLGPLGLATLTLPNIAPGIFESSPVTIPSSTATGAYTARVTAQDAAGATSTADLQIEVLAVAPPHFTAPNVVAPSTTAIEITGPERGRDFATNERGVILTGAASPDIATIEVNGHAISHVAGMETWSTEIQLEDGENVLTVRAFNLARSVEVSDEVSIELDQGTPERVRDLTASAGALTWSAPKSRDVEGYHVYKLDGKKAKRIGTTRKREYSVPGAGAYAVIAEDSAGNALDPKKGASVTVGASSSAFADVPATHFARTAVETLVARGAVQAGTYFRPETPITRGEFAKLLVLSLGGKADGSSNALTDVSSAHSLAPFITAAVRERWAHGDGGRFYPDRPISRGEAALMLVRARNLPLRTEQLFSDTSGDVGRAAAALREVGIVSGVNGRFEPQRALLRGEAAKIVASR
ncbi:MAG: S8 family serine peptidase [Acidobacteriota bacterium]